MCLANGPTRLANGPTRNDYTFTMSLPVTTTFTFEGYRVKEYKGVVRGLIVRAPTISQGFFGGLKSIVGGRIESYTQMCEQARSQAFELLIDHARAVGANAVVGLRFESADVAGKGATEVLCYGTAVIIEPTTSASAPAVPTTNANA